MKFRSAIQADIAQICALERLPEFRTMVGPGRKISICACWPTLVLPTSLLKINQYGSPASRSCRGCCRSIDRWNSNALWCVLPTRALASNF